ncbi:retron St85 family effector protein [Ornithinibacillus massiliensis]|uniref:Retron St85 family effector protein n=1 Tax=Ornithinibacillus massiliensis TaxID=1944633 RepID=A0ABS5M9Y3_9BACI|nr:retron St85 family effector protein [Ornithinibacillus massiliensis]MBS3678965.1 retron St85 family effector protein [Ornithinibacillus massiliensis]
MNGYFLKIKIDTGLQIYLKSIDKIKEIFTSEYNIFLVGASTENKTSIRAQLFEMLRDKKKINVRFPEDIFDEQIYQDNYDLLSLENLLANSVDAVVMCVESSGSIAELGAFSNHNGLNNKLIIYMDKQYQKSESFINLGPIKFLRNKTRSNVFWIDYDKEIKKYEEDFYYNLLKSLRKIKKENSNLTIDLTNPFVTMRYILSLLYTLESCTRKEFVEIVKHVGVKINIHKDVIEEYITLVDSAIGILISNEEIYKDFDNYFITLKGKARLEDELGSKYIHSFLDNLRLKMLNLQLRKYWN